MKNENTFKFICAKCKQPMETEIDNQGSQIYCPCCQLLITIPHKNWLDDVLYSLLGLTLKAYTSYTYISYETETYKPLEKFKYESTTSCFHCIVGNAVMIAHNEITGLFQCPCCGGLTKKENYKNILY